MNCNKDKAGRTGGNEKKDREKQSEHLFDIGEKWYNQIRNQQSD